MPATVTVGSGERPALGFALSRSAKFYANGTTEQRETAASLAQMLQGLESAPEGAVAVELLTQDAYSLGIRLFYASVELEDYLLDTVAQSSGVALPPPDPVLAQTVAHFFPDLIAGPDSRDFEPVRGLFTDLGKKLNDALTEVAPRARALYNSDREEMTDKAVAIREVNARYRASAAEALGAGGVATAVASVSSDSAAEAEWGVEFATGLAPDDVPADSFRVLSVGSVRVLLTRCDGALAAIDGHCSHQRASLSKGNQVGATIECPRHGATFDLRSGRELCPPFCQKWMEQRGMLGGILALVTPDKKAGDLPRYPLRVENGQIVLRI